MIWLAKGMGIRLGDSHADCLTNQRFADDVLLFATSLEQLLRMMCDCKTSTERVGLKIHPDKTKILSNQGIGQKKRGVDRQHQSRGITSEWVCEVSRTNNKVRAIRNNGYQETNPSSLGIVYQVQTGANIEIVPFATQNFAYSSWWSLPRWLTLLEHGPFRRTRKIDLITTTQNASPDYTDKKKVQ